MKDRFRDYRMLAAECLRLAGATDEAHAHAQYVALAQMWNDLAEEAENGRATFSKARNAFNEAQVVHQQQQVQPTHQDDDKS